MWHVERTSTLAADLASVWGRAVTAEGIDDELRPWLGMSFPTGAGIDTVELGVPLGRARLRLFGLLPVEYDDLVVVELEPGRRFREDSTMRSMRRWEHERTVEASPEGGSVVADRVSLEPRAVLRWAGPLLRAVVTGLFAHRHRRLARRHGRP